MAWPFEQELRIKKQKDLSLKTRMCIFPRTMELGKYQIFGDVYLKSWVEEAYNTNIWASQLTWEKKRERESSWSAALAGWVLTLLPGLWFGGGVVGREGRHWARQVCGLWSHKGLESGALSLVLSSVTLRKLIKLSEPVSALVKWPSETFFAVMEWENKDFKHV